MAPRAGDSVTLFIDVGEVHADLAAVDALARLALIARRRGYAIALRGASSELLDLIEFSGLGEVLPREPLRSGSTQPRC